MPGESRAFLLLIPEEIFAAGGATAFGIKSGKNNETLKRALENSPKPDFTKEEWASLLRQMANKPS